MGGTSESEGKKKGRRCGFPEKANAKRRKKTRRPRPMGGSPKTSRATETALEGYKVWRIRENTRGGRLDNGRNGKLRKKGRSQ